MCSYALSFRIKCTVFNRPTSDVCSPPLHPRLNSILCLPAVELPGKVVDLRSGFSHAVAILENGDVYIWGRMQGTKVKTDARVPVYEDQLYPRKVDIAGGGRAVEAFCSSFNTLLRMDDGRCVYFCRFSGVFNLFNFAQQQCNFHHRAKWPLAVN